jgi:integrase
MMLHGVFNFAIRKEFCDKNQISQIPKKRIVEKEIVPLSLPKIRKLYKSAESNFSGECVVPFALMLWAGIRPKEVRRLRWKDIDLTENIITITSQNSKTGGTRHITILPVLKKILLQHQKANETPITPPNWDNKWRYVRKHADLQAKWQQDVLRHTFASYHAKHFKNLSQLQLEMGHHNLSLLRSRYINMQGISKKSAKEFFRLKNICNLVE